MTVIVSVLIPPELISFGPKVYVGATVLLPLVKVPSPLLLQDITPCVAVYPTGMVYVEVVAQTEADDVLPAAAVGAGMIVSENVAVAAGHTPAGVTCIVSIFVPPLAISLGPKLYTGVVVFPPVKLPSPVEVQEMVPLVAEYPPDILYELELAHTVADPLPVAVAATFMVSVNDAVAVQPPLSMVIVSVLVPPTALSFGPKTYVGFAVVPLVKLPSPVEAQEIVPTGDEDENPDIV